MHNGVQALPDLTAQLQEQPKDHVRAGLGEKRYAKILCGEFPEKRHSVNDTGSGPR